MEYRSIYRLLRYGTNARVSVGRRWLVVDEETGDFIVYEHRHGAKKVTVVARTGSESEAVAALSPDD